MPEMRCSFCFRGVSDTLRGVAGGRAYICGRCIAAAVAALVSDNETTSSMLPFHPATDDFLSQFDAFRDQLESDHGTPDEHKRWAAALDQLEGALKTLHELLSADRAH